MPATPVDPDRKSPVGAEQAGQGPEALEGESKIGDPCHDKSSGPDKVYVNPGLG